MRPLQLGHCVLFAFVTAGGCTPTEKDVDPIGGNVAPVVGSAQLDPDPGFEGSELICSALGVADDDGDDVELAFAWTVSDIEIAATTERLTGADFSRDDQVYCTITPSDVSATGTPVNSNTVTILNTAPVGAAVDVIPAPGTVVDDLTATPVGFFDADGDDELWRYAWFINGVAAGADTAVLSNGYVKGDTVYVIATPDDRIEQGDPIQSDNIDIINSPPALQSAEVQPPYPTANDVLVCIPSGPSDPDNDIVAFDFQWFVNGGAAGTNTDLLAAPNFARGDNVHCQITPTDGEDDGAAVLSNTVTIENSVPVVGAAVLSPDPAFEDTILTCSASGLTDPDNDAVTLTFNWEVGGLSIPATSSTLDGASFDRGQAVQCMVTPNDGLDQGLAVASNIIVISNSPPSANQVAVAPVGPYTDTDVSAVVTGWIDLDNDLEAYQYQWSKNGVPVPGETAVTLANTNYVKHDLLSVTATPDDGITLGIPLVSADEEVLNTPPELASAAITPLNPLATDTIDCIESGPFDLDGDPVTVDWDWYVDGALATSGVNQLAPAFFSNGQDVWCIATPNDGEEDGTPVQSNTVRIENSDPVVTSVTLSPDPAFEGDFMLCTENGMMDPDGDPVTAIYEWIVGGLVIPPVTNSISGVWFDKGDAVQCTVTPDDGVAQGPTIPSNIVIIGNTPPSATSVAISPDPAFTNDNLSATVTGWADIDGDIEGYVYEWSVNGVSLPGETGSSLANANFSRDDTVSVTATPDDGSDLGPPVVSPDLIITNTPPELVTANLSPPSPNVADILTCTPLGPSDLDGDVVSYFYQWFVDGLDSGITTPTLAAPFFASGNTVWCVVTPNDGTDPGASVLSNIVIVSNSAPTIAAVTVAPDPAFEADILTCTPNGALDLDGDPISFSYSWAVNAIPIPVISDTINGIWFDKNDFVQCTVTPDDGTDSGPAVPSNVVVIQNTPPSAASVSINPAFPNTNEDVSASVLGWADADGDLEGYVYEWTVNGGVVFGATGATLPNTNYVRDDIIGLTVTPDDGTDLGTPLIAVDALVVNSPPTVASAAVTPLNPTVLDMLTCTPGGPADLDGDPVSFLYQWFVDGLPAGIGTDTLAAPDFARGQDVWCQVTPDDGTDLGLGVLSNVVTVGNLAPEVASVDLAPDPAFEADILTCTPVGATDADGDPVGFTYGWTVNGLPIAVVSNNLDGTWFDKNDAVQCSVIPDDGTDAGALVLSNTVVIGNTPPSAISVSIAPDPAFTSDGLTANVVGWNDVDGDLEGYVFEWTVNAVVVPGETGQLLGSGFFVKNDVVVVTATPNDGTDLGLPVVSLGLTIFNTPPTLVSADLSPTNPSISDVLTCTPLGPADLDGDAVGYVYQWYTNGLPVGTGVNTLAAPDFGSGDSVQCEITPDDGDDLGVPVLSNLVVVGNTPPTLTSVTLAPDPAFEASLLTCTGNGPFDADGDPVSMTYEWIVNGFVVPNVSNTINGLWFNKNDAVQCAVTPNDTFVDGAQVLSNVVVISNTPPSATDVTLAPLSPLTTQDVTATVNGWADDDGDIEGYLYSWTVNAAVVVGETSATLPSSNYVRGDVIVVTATPDDGTDLGAPVVSLGSTVQNSPPAVAIAALSPLDPNEYDILACSPLGVSDPDGDAVGYTYEWFVDGLPVGGNTPTLDGADFDSGQDIYCVITPDDGTDNGAPVQSNTVTAANLPPVVATATLAPEPAFEADILTCTGGGVFDGDGDPVTLAYSWTVNGFGVAIVANVLDGTWFDKNDTVQCAITPNDGLVDGAQVLSNVVVISNTPPSATGVTLAPLSPLTTQDVTATVNGWADDDGDIEGYLYSWTVNAAVAVGETSATLPSSNYVRGDVIVVTATPDDGTDLGAPVVSLGSTVQNSPPALASASLSPLDPDENDVLTCTPLGATDADGDAVGYTYEWFVDGLPVGGNTPTLDGADFDSGQDIYCVVTPDDGTDNGAPVQSNTVTAANLPPVVATATLAPEPAFEADILTCTGGGVFDGDGDPVTLAYAWTVNGFGVAVVANVLDGTWFDKNDTVQCAITPNDGVVDGAQVLSNVVVISNTPPSATSVTLAPLSPFTDEDVTATVSGWADDDGDIEGYLYSWTVNAAVVGETSATLGSANYVRGDVIIVTATPDDGTDLGAPVVSLGSTVQNSPPDLVGASLSPSDPDDNDTLTCAPLGPSDADGDAVGYTYEWFVDGLPVGGNTPTLTGADFDRGQDIYCVVTPDDGTDDGIPVQSNVVTAVNIPPVVATATLAPDPAYELDILTCTGGGVFDGDGDPVTLAYAWTVNGFGVPIVANSLDGTWFDKNDAVQCAITPNDGVVDGAQVMSNVVVITNTPPSATSVTLAPLTPFTNQDVVATVLGWNDDDGDPENYLWEWTVNAIVVAGATTDTLSSAEFVKGDAIQATATPDDGTDLGLPVVSAATVAQNSLPVIGSVNLTPVAPNIASVLTCTPSGTTDGDGDGVTYTYAWFVDGVLDPAETGNTVSAPTFAAGQQVYCEVTPNDGDADGATVQSNLVVVGNTPPTIASVTLTPDPAYEGNTLTCTANGVSDADGDPVALIYSWTVGGLPVAAVGNTLGSSFFDRGQAVQCTVTPDDGFTPGTPVQSNVVVISNTPPSAVSAVITPVPAYTTSGLTVTASGWSDADGDPEGYTYEWYVNAVQVAGEFTNTLSNIYFVKNNTISAIAIPDDGIDLGAPVIAPDLVISNSIPTAPVVDVSPDPADDGDNLTCSVTVPSSDADGDLVTYTYRWLVNGVDAGIAAANVPGATTAFGDLWECFALPNDGQDNGPEGTDLVVIEDLVAPGAPVLDPIDEFRNDPSVDLTGTAEPNATVTIYATCDMGSGGQSATVADLLGDFNFNWIMVAGETCSFYVDAEDASGNVSAPSNIVQTTVCSVPDPWEDAAPGYGNNNLDPVDEWGPLIDNGATTYYLEGNMLPQDVGDWFVVYGDDDPVADNIAGANQYNINVTLTGGMGTFTFLVYKSDVGVGDLECPAFLGTGYDDYNDYWYDRGDAPDHAQAAPTDLCTNGSSSMNECEDMGTPYYIQVLRDAAAPPSCAAYQISVTNGL